jgi:hypothetical protein
MRRTFPSPREADMPEASDVRYQAYMDAIRARVCAVCLDRRDDGSCHLAAGRLCAIEHHLPRLVEAVLAVHSDRMDEYVEAVKSQVCGSCSGRDPHDYCPFRTSAECALWTYLPLVVDAVEEVRNGPGPAA